MALSSNFISFIFFTTLLFSLQINARESQFFSKVTNVNNNNNAKETTDLPYKEGPVNKPEQQQQQQPAFIPESENSYGLYGHQDESYKPYKTNTEFEDNNKYFNYDNNAFNNNNNNQNNEFSNTRLTGTGYYSNNNNYNKDNAFGGYQNENELSDTKYTEEGSGYNSMENQNNNQMYYNNNNNNEKYNNNNNAANENYFYSSNNNNNNYNNGANNKYNGERQGMSDTRFMHGGKYFYDVNSEKYSTPLHGDAYKGFNNQNWYNNNNNNYYNEYQNQENFEDEFDNSQP